MKNRNNKKKQKWKYENMDFIILIWKPKTNVTI